MDTIETLQGEGVAFLVEGVAFFRGVMHLGRSVFHLARRVFHLGWRLMSDAFIVHEMGQGSVAFGVHEMGTLVHLVSTQRGSPSSARGFSLLLIVE